MTPNKTTPSREELLRLCDRVLADINEWQSHPVATALRHHLTTSPASPDHGDSAGPFCNVCFDDVARCKANPDDCPGKPHPDDPHTQALDALRAENDLVRRNYSGLLAFARDVSRDPLNAKRALAQELLDTGVYQVAEPDGDSALRRISAAPENTSAPVATRAAGVGEMDLAPLNDAITEQIALKHSYCVGVLENVRRLIRRQHGGP